MGYITDIHEGELMKVQATHTIKRSGKVVVTKGDVITEAQAIKKKVTQYTVPVQRVKYTTEDYEQMVRTYVGDPNASIPELVAHFIESHPTTSATTSGLNMYFSVIRGQDQCHPHVGLEHPAQELMAMLRLAAPHRFM
jgi:hypothetical protein